MKKQTGQSNGINMTSNGTWGKEERDAAMRVIDSGMVTMGEKTREFEEAYAKYVGTRYCVAVNSGSSANLLMVAAWTLRYGAGTVVVPAVGWATSYSPFLQYGWKLRFVDVDKDSLNFDLQKLRLACNGADLILAINLLGNPNEFSDFPKWVPMLEDNCESMGASYHGKMCGSFGVMSSHSTYFSHHICTMEGGMVTTDDKYFYEMLLSLRSHGWTRHLPHSNVFNESVEAFRFILPGYNVRPTEVQCAIGIEQLKKLPEFVAQRRENASRFPVQTQREIGNSSWFGFAVYGEDRDRFSSYKNTRPIVTGNFLRQPVMKHYKYEVAGPLPNANYVHDYGMMIPNSHERIEWKTE